MLSCDLESVQGWLWFDLYIYVCVYEGTCMNRHMHTSSCVCVLHFWKKNLTNQLKLSTILSTRYLKEQSLLVISLVFNSWGMSVTCVQTCITSVEVNIVVPQKPVNWSTLRLSYTTLGCMLKGHSIPTRKTYNYVHRSLIYNSKNLETI